MAYVFNPITGKLDDAGTPTTDASLLTSGTLADARLSANVSLDNINNNFSASQTFAGSANTAPSQTAASGSSLMTRDLSDDRFVNKSISTLPAPTFTSGSGSTLCQVWLKESWVIPAQVNGLSSNNSYGAQYISGIYSVKGATGSSTKICNNGNASGFVAGSAGVINYCGSFRDTGVANSDFVGNGNSVDLLSNVVSSRFRLYNSGVASNGLRYRFSVNFAASAGDTIVMSPSGHTFVVDRTITDATVFTSSVVGGVFVRTINGGGTPTGTDVSLTVNGGSSIVTTFSANSASNTSTMPECVLFPSSTGWNLIIKTFGTSGFFQLETIF
jgi:hypothetical protein